MTLDQGLLFAILAALMVLFATGYWRYDLAALAGLLAMAVLGLVPSDETFSGFAHPAVITVAAVLVVSRGLQNAGVIDLIAGPLSRTGDRGWVHVLALCTAVALLSGFINNVGALALLMPAAVGLARSLNRSPAYLLMPLAFASQLGGLTTLIGTPANLIVSGARADALGEGFGMFTFTPLGLVMAVAGVVTLAAAAPWLTPRHSDKHGADALFEITNYTSELHVLEESEAADMTIGGLERLAEGDAVVVGLVRNDRTILAPSSYESLRVGDGVIVEADPDTLKRLVDKAGLKFDDVEVHEKELKADDIKLMEAVVRPESRIVGRSAQSLFLRSIYGVNLLAVAREGARVSRRPSRLRFRAGDVVLLQGRDESLRRATQSLGCLPLAERAITLGRPPRMLFAVAVFAAAIASTTLGVLPVEAAFTLAAAVMVAGRILSLEDAYEAIEWPVILLLACLLPAGAALQRTGGDEFIAQGLLAAAGALPIGAAGLLLVATMLLSNIINNAGVAVVMAPVALRMAETLGDSPDRFLLAIVAGASCAFLTPVGHQSNALVMGPGGYRFGDYWRLGAVLSATSAVVALLAIHAWW